MNQSAFEEDVRAYIGALPELLRTSNGKFVLIAEASLRGIYESHEEALAQGVRGFSEGGFLAQKIVEADLVSGQRWLAACQP